MTSHCALKESTNKILFTVTIESRMIFNFCINIKTNHRIKESELLLREESKKDMEIHCGDFIARSTIIQVVQATILCLRQWVPISEKHEVKSPLIVQPGQ